MSKGTSESRVPRFSTNDLLVTVRREIKRALGLAVAASLFVLLGGLFRGGTNAEWVFIGLIVVLYFSCAIVAGVVYGLLSRFRTSAFRSALTGAAAAFGPGLLVSSVFAYLSERLRLSIPAIIAAALVGALVFGVPFGLGDWDGNEEG